MAKSHRTAPLKKSVSASKNKRPISKRPLKELKKRLVPQKTKKPLLVHARHTGKRLPVRHSSFALLGLILLLVGIFLASISWQVQAADLGVSAKVSAPLPSGPATISSPSDQAHFTSIPIVVNGTCPADEFVKIYRTNVFSGSVQCSSSGDFTLQTDLFAGGNDLQAKIFNKTDDEGPTSPSIKVYYDAPVPVIPPPVSQPVAAPPQPDGTPALEPVHTQLLLRADSSYRAYQLGQKIEWNIEITGGTAPYSVQVDWGDGQTTTYTRNSEGTITVGHNYAKVSEKGRYAVKISASDGSGQHAFIQLTGVPNAALLTSSSGVVLSESQPTRNMLNMAWMGYLFALVALCSFWLGSRWIIRTPPRRTAVHH